MFSWDKPKLEVAGVANKCCEIKVKWGGIKYKLLDRKMETQKIRWCDFAAKGICSFFVHCACNFIIANLVTHILFVNKSLQHDFGSDVELDYIGLY